VDTAEKNLSDNLKMHMALRGLSTQQVADLAELSYQAVYHVLNQERWPSAENLTRLARAVRSTPAALLAEPVAQEKPDVATAWKVLREFMDTLTPAKFLLNEVVQPLNDRETMRAVELLTLISRISPGEADHILESLRVLVRKKQDLKLAKDGG